MDGDDGQGTETERAGAAEEAAPVDPWSASLEAEEVARRRAARWGRWGALVLVLLAAASLLVPLGFLLVGFFLPLGLAVATRQQGRRPGAPRLGGAPGLVWLFAGFAMLAVGTISRGTAVAQREPMVLLGAFLYTAVAASALLARRTVLRVRLERDLPSRAQAGRAFEATLRVRGEGGVALPPLIVREHLGVLARPALVEAVFEGVEAGDSEAATARIAFDRRGWRRLKPALVATRHPLGAFEASVETVAPAEVLVRPREGRVSAALIARLRGASSNAGRLVAARSGTDHLYGLREYRDGDDPRRIHWRTTARRGQRTLVEWREEQARRVAVVLARGSRHAVEADAERAVSVAATLLRACVRLGIRARLVLGERMPGDDAGIDVRGRRGLERALDALAVVRWGGGRRPAAWLKRAGRGPDAETVAWIGVGPDAEADAARRATGGAVLPLRTDDAAALRRWVRGLP